MKKMKKLLSTIAVILAISVVTPSLLPISSVSAAEDSTAITTTMPGVADQTEVSSVETTAVESTSPSISNGEPTLGTTQDTTTPVTEMTEDTTISLIPTEQSIVQSVTPTPTVTVESTTIPTPVPSVEPTKAPFVDIDNDFGNFTGIPKAYPSKTGKGWSPAYPVIIDQGAHMQFFTNKWGTPLQTNEYYIEGTGEVAYCVDQEAVGPSGTSYGEGNLSNPAYSKGVAAIILSGYPFNSNGLSSQDARYATATAIHWLENYVFSGSEGWDCSIRNETNANGHDGALAFALQLFDIGVAQSIPDANVQLYAPTPWIVPSGGTYLRTSVYLDESNTSTWTATAPAGTKIVTAGGLVDSYTGSGDTTLYLDLVNPTQYSAGNKILSVEPNTDTDITNVKVFVAGGNYQTIASAKAITVTKDPDTTPLPAALGSFQLTKDYYLYTGSTRAEEGAVYQVWLKSESSTYAGATTKWTLTTDSSGKTPIVKNVTPGEYYVKQITAGVDTAGLSNLTVDPTRFTITVAAGTTTTQTYYNQKKLSLEIYKELTKADGSKVPEPGAVFEIWHSDYVTFAAATAAGYGWTKTTDAAGKINLDYLDKDGTYYAKQVGTSDQAISMIAGTTTIVGTHGNQVTVNLVNKEQTGFVALEKTEDWTEGYYTTVAGIVFRMYRMPVGSTATAFDPSAYNTAGAYQKAELTLDANGKATSGKLLLGTYIVTQVTTPDSHKKVADFKVVVSADGTTYTKQLTNSPIVGYVDITKYQAEGDAAGTIATEAGAQFAIYPSIYTSWMAAKAALIEGSNKFKAFTEVITTDSNGYAKSAALPYGEYRVEQIVTPNPNYKMVTPWTVTINEDSKTYSYLKNNLRVPFYLRVLKEDGYYHTPLAGATFQLYQVSDYQGTLAEPLLIADKQGKTSFTSDVLGTCDWNNVMLGIGRYYVIETSCPTGYGLDNTKHFFDITGEPDQDTIVINDRFVHTLTMTNAKIQGVISIAKVSNLGKLPLMGVEFDVFSQDGTLVDHIKTDAAGYCQTKILPEGTYTVIETKTCDGYALDSTKHTINIDKTPEAAQEYVTYDLDLINIKIQGIININKISDDTRLPLAGVGFDLFASDGTLIEHLTTDADGTCKTQVLPKGVYTIVETATCDGYALDDTIYAINIDKTPEAAKEYVNYELNITNKKMASIEIYKVTGDGKSAVPMKGVEFGLYDATSNKLLATLVTDKNGYAQIYQEPGSYYLKELKTWDGYALSPDKIQIQAEWTGIYKYNLSNKKTKVTIEKTDITDGKPVPGATITITDKDGKKIREGVTDEAGKLVIEGLQPGTYTFQEKVHPQGYTLNTESFKFTVDQYGKVTGVTKFSDEPTALILHKTDSKTGNPLDGAEFTVTHSNGTQLRFKLENGIWIANAAGEYDHIVTNKDGKAEVRYLPQGVYNVRETKAPVGYTLSDQIYQVEITDATGILAPAELTIKNNAVLGVAKTGELDSFAGLIAVIMMLAAIAALGVFGTRKHKQLITEMCKSGRSFRTIFDRQRKKQNFQSRSLRRQKICKHRSLGRHSIRPSSRKKE